MKKLLSLITAVLLIFCLSACKKDIDLDKMGTSTTLPSQGQEIKDKGTISEPFTTSDDDQSQNTETGQPLQRQIIMTAKGQTYKIILYENPAADALYQLLPLELTFEDYNSIEKIAYLPKDKILSTEGKPDGYDPSAGDFCLYEPWGNLSLFYKDFGYSNGLICLGRLESGVENISLLTDDFTVTIKEAN